jgi:hypothetical protein
MERQRFERKSINKGGENNEKNKMAEKREFGVYKFAVTHGGNGIWSWQR